MSKDNKDLREKFLDNWGKRKEAEALFNKTIGNLDEELKKIAKKLMNLIPPELKIFKGNFFYPEKQFHETLAKWMKAWEKDSWPSDKIKDLTNYGFKDMDDAYKKLKLLRKAWKGIINVVVEYDDWYVSLYFKKP